MSEKNLGFCGYEAQPAPFEFNEDSLPWTHWERTGNSTYRCLRPIWGSDRCIWHADEPGKPVNKFQEARDDDTERLDGAIFREIDLYSVGFLAGCSLQGAEFEKVMLERANFEDTRLWEANFTEEIEGANANFHRSDMRNIRTTDVDEIDFDGATFTEANLNNAVFTGVSQIGNDEPHVSFAGADFKRATMVSAEFCRCNLRQATLAVADARSAKFCSANLEEADITRMDLRGAVFSEARLFWALLSDVRVNSRTVFGEKCIYETDPDRFVIGLDEDIEGYEAAAWVYRRLQTVYHENGFTDEAREYHVRKRESKRKLAKENGETIRSVLSRIDQVITRHGERPRRVLCWWIAIIVLSASIYSILGIRDSTTLYQFSLTGNWNIYAGVAVILQSLNFSIASFSTLGAGNVMPANEWVRGLSSIESLLGSLFIALYVFALGRRVDW